MKNYSLNKSKTALFLVAFIGVFTFASCTESAEDPKDIAEDQNDAIYSEEKEKQAENLVSAAEINLTEIELGKLAQSKSSNPDVIKLGEMMETQHTKAFKDLKKLAEKKKVSIPEMLTNDGKKAYDKLNDKSGTKFDKAYSEMMVEGHKDAISLFNDIFNESKDLEVKKWAELTLPELREHLIHATDCKEKCDNAEKAA